MESLVPEYSVAGIVRERSGSILPGIAPSNVYRCSDGDYMIGANNDAIFARLAKAMGAPEMADDTRYKTHGARGANQTELDDIINAWTATLTVDEVEALMLEASVPAGRVYRGPEMLDDPHFEAREAIVEVPHPRWRNLKMQNVFPKMSATPGAIRSIAPQTVGQDNAAVLGELLGLSEADLAKLKTEGVI
jgi:formyl-CoA transferase